jgi:hypothetical protein
MRSTSLFWLALPLASVIACAPEANAPSVVSLDTDRAVSLVRSYETALGAGDWSTAWGQLSAPAQASFGSFAAFVNAGSTEQQITKGQFVVRPPVSDGGAAARWIADAPPGTPSHGFLIEVDHPVVDANSGWEMLLVAMDGGPPRIWPLR